jgi:hypothetical protein
VGLFWLIMALGFIALIRFPDWFKVNIHGIAGFLMLLSFIITVFCAACVVGQEDIKKSPHRGRYQVWYWIIAAIMLLTLFAVVAVHIKHPGWEPWIILLESLVIFEFALYWAVQTVELWNSPDRRGRLPDDVQRRLADKRGAGLRGFRSDPTAPQDEGLGARLLQLL